jgi:hypothetical protein
MVQNTEGAGGFPETRNPVDGYSGGIAVPMTGRDLFDYLVNKVPLTEVTSRLGWKLVHGSGTVIDLNNVDRSPRVDFLTMSLDPSWSDGIGAASSSSSGDRGIKNQVGNKSTR